MAGEVAEQVAEHIEDVADVTREIDKRVVGSFLGGVGFGVVLGFFFGYRYNREKIYAEAFRKSAEEVEKIREVYQARETARQPKPSVEDVLEERGYSVATDKVQEAEEAQERPTRPPVPVRDPSQERKPIIVPQPTIKLDTGKSKDLRWDYAEELQNRNPGYPYIIHQDEFNQQDGPYSHVALTFYAGDGVLVDEDDSPIRNIDTIVGAENLTRFGHGSDDYNVVFIRNEHLQIEYEIIRSPDSYEEEVQGLSNESPETA